MRPAHDPFADPGDALAVVGAGGDGVRSPVDEHPELRIAPPGHAGVALRRGFLREVLGRGAACRGEKEQESENDDALRVHVWSP